MFGWLLFLYLLPFINAVQCLLQFCLIFFSFLLLTSLKVQQCVQHTHTHKQITNVKRQCSLSEEWTRINIKLHSFGLWWDPKCANLVKVKWTICNTTEARKKKHKKLSQNLLETLWVKHTKSHSIHLDARICEYLPSPSY